MDTTLHDPSIYHGIEALGVVPDRQGWNSDHEIFKKLIMMTAPAVIIEVGSWKGRSAISMLDKAEQLAEEWGSPLKPHLFCVDTWLGSPEIWRNPHLWETNPRRHGYPQLYFQFLTNVKKAGYESQVTPLPMTSSHGAHVLRDAGVKAELIYIDASHDYVDVINDLKLYWELLSPGGIMLGDDLGFPGVNTAVTEFCLTRGLTYQVVDENFWWIANGVKA